MNVKVFNIKDLNLKFFVGINQIKLDFDKFLEYYNIINKEKVLKRFFTIVEEIQNKNENSAIQFIKDKYILNQDHIFTACYYVEKAFLQKSNISMKKTIEILLYLAANRQINKSIDAFGIDYSDLNKKTLIYCIISPINNLDKINGELISVLNAQQKEMTINNLSNAKINLLKEYFEISDNQLNSVLKSYGINKNNSKINFNQIGSALFDLICEKMALLHIERINII